MKYKVVETKSIYELQDMVNSLIKDGYIPLGGVSHSVDTFRDFYCQAMIKN